MTTTVRGARGRIVSKWTSEMGSVVIAVAIVAAILLTGGFFSVFLFYDGVSFFRCFYFIVFFLFLFWKRGQLKRWISRARAALNKQKCAHTHTARKTKTKTNYIFVMGFKFIIIIIILSKQFIVNARGKLWKTFCDVSFNGRAPHHWEWGNEEKLFY